MRRLFNGPVATGFLSKRAEEALGCSEATGSLHLFEACSMINMESWD